ncbi:NaeI family type II restriction endonuclease [Microbispora bryophytorum]|uniref:NaeI family type II restriction endonuclease n=1 Tax=Microbispora bryophytorum TaxID=1460882 RepID=UPI0033F9E439
MQETSAHPPTCLPCAASPGLVAVDQPTDLYVMDSDGRPLTCQAGQRRRSSTRRSEKPGRTPPSPHTVLRPEADGQLQYLVEWWSAQPDIVARFGNAIDSAIQYVLDGARTGRFDLQDRRVDPDERRSVGTKLQFHVLEEFKLPRKKSPDTAVGEVAFDIKGTVRGNWSIPVEAQCEICLLVQINIKKRTHRAWLMRTHRKWLHNGDGNGDQKRGINKEAHGKYAIPLYSEAPLPMAPLTLLNDEQLALVFGPEGQKKRLTHLFSMLKNVVIGRATILTVCAGRDDPLRRAREARSIMKDNGYALLCGAWTPQRQMAGLLGHDLSGNAWVSVPWEDILNHGPLTAEVLNSMERKDPDSIEP